MTSTTFVIVYSLTRQLHVAVTIASIGRPILNATQRRVLLAKI
eukprot:COSAG05_NODE_13361_length_433_cov_0.928144_1_plen_42_part_10